jgi:hypothetical protein
LFFAVVLAALMLAGCPTDPDPEEAPATPPKPIVTSNEDKLTITWPPVTGATEYRVYYGTSPNPTAQYGNAISDTSINITVSENGIYYVRIKASNSKGASDYSPEDSTFVTVNDTPSVIGSWRADNGGIYSFTEDKKLTKTSTSGPTENYIYDSATKEFYRASSPEPAGHYALSEGKLQITTFELPTIYQREEETDNEIVGTWKPQGSDEASWTFNADKTAKRTYSKGSETNYRYELSGSKISMEKEEEAGILSGNTFTLWGNVVFNRKDSGSGITGSWSTSENGWTITCTITEDKLEYMETKEGKESYSESMSIRIDGNKIYELDEYGYKLEGDTLTLIREWTEECSPVTN